MEDELFAAVLGPGRGPAPEYPPPSIRSRTRSRPSVSGLPYDQAVRSELERVDGLTALRDCERDLGRTPTRATYDAWRVSPASPSALAPSATRLCTRSATGARPSRLPASSAARSELCAARGATSP
jgi:hypothetical protein